MLIGLISDTHGSLPPGVARVFRSCERILHAGDVGSIEVLRGLEDIAPVIAVAGNVDPPGLAAMLGEVARFEHGGASVIVAHTVQAALRAHAVQPGTVLVCGHTHVPVVERTDDVLLVNPGSPSRPRSPLGPTVGLLELAAQGPSARIVRLSRHL
ncbi:MAG: metallophosphatase family protein [Coriobacteriia bacterium]|nr:metallophosphatase family protein [Coriobacteriia bacterium]